MGKEMWSSEMCSWPGCTESADQFYLHSRAKQCVCAAHVPAHSTAFPLKALKFLTDAEDFDLFLAREREAKQALGQLEALRTVLDGERQRACTLMQESQDRMLNTLAAVFAAEQRRVMQFYYQLEVQLQLVAAEFAAYLSDKSFRLSSVAQAAANRCKVKTSPMLRVEVNDYIADLPKLVGSWIWKSERPPDEIVLGIFDKTERRKQFYELLANAETLAKSGYIPSMTIAVHHYEGLKNQIRFEKKNLQSLEADLEVKKTEMMETVKEILSADNPSVHTLIAKYKSRMKSRGVTAEGKAALLDDMLQFLRFYSDSPETATLFTDLVKQFAHDRSKQIYLLNLSYSILEKHSPYSTAIVEVLEKLGVLFSKTSPEKAEQCYISAIRIRRRMDSEDPLQVIDNLALGDINRRWGQFDRALLCYQLARNRQIELDVPLDQLFLTYYKELKTLSHARSVEAALALYSQVAAMMGGLADAALAAKCHLVVATLLTETGKFRDALTLLRTAAAAVANCPDSVTKAKVMERLGVLLGLQGSHQQSVYALSEALRLYTLDASNPNKIFYVSYSLGTSYRCSGDEETAKKVFEESLQYSLKEGNNVWLMEIYNSLGTIYNDSGALDDAEACFKCCLRVIENVQTGQFLGVMARINLALCYERKNQWAEAERLYLSTAEILKEKYPEVPIIAQVRGNLAVLYERSNRVAEAMESYEQGLQALDPNTYPTYSAWQHYCFGHSLLDTDEAAAEVHFAEALRLWKLAKVAETADTVFEAFEHPKDDFERQGVLLKQGSMICHNRQAEAHEFLGCISQSKQCTKQAKSHWRKALRIYQEQGRGERAEIVQQYLQTVSS